MANKVTVEKGRAPLQTGTVARLGLPSDGDNIPVWLFVVDPGHLRVFSKEEVVSLFDLEEANRTDILAVETQEERQRLGALRIRLIPSSVVPERRLKIPAEVFDICGEFVDRSHVWLEQSSSQLHIYTATYVRRLLEIPPSQILPPNFKL